MGAPAVVLGPHRNYRVGIIRVKGDEDGHGRERPDPHPIGLLVLGGVTKEAKTNGIVSQ